MLHSSRWNNELESITKWVKLGLVALEAKAVMIMCEYSARTFGNVESSASDVLLSSTTEAETFWDKENKQILLFMALWVQKWGNYSLKQRSKKFNVILKCFVKYFSCRTSQSVPCVEFGINNNGADSEHELVCWIEDWSKFESINTWNKVGFVLAESKNITFMNKSKLGQFHKLRNHVSFHYHICCSFNIWK